MRSVRPVSNEWVEQTPLGDYCGTCGAYWQCEHRVAWSPGQVEGPTPRELAELDDAARILRRRRPQNDIQVRRCNRCAHWAACIDGLCGDCHGGDHPSARSDMVDPARPLTYENLVEARRLLS